MTRRKKFDRVYQFKITLKEVSPAIWRRIQVPETYSFWDLHVAIQDAMGWLDYHLHEFQFIHPEMGFPIVRIGIPGEEVADEEPPFPGWEAKIAEDELFEKYKSANYLYDFGDDWKHVVRLEKILPRNLDIRYPVCVDGKRACPPEDCGGPRGYADFLRIIRNPRHEEHESTLKWVGGKFNPEIFLPDKVHFWNPEKRWKIAFSEP